MKEKEKSPFDVITGYSVNEGLIGALQQNEEYREIQKRFRDCGSLLWDMGLLESV